MMTVDEILDQIEAREKALAAEMPTELDALALTFRAKQRLIDLGWKEANYAPQDGRCIDVIVFGCQQPMCAIYIGKPGSGMWFVQDGGDLWPCIIVMWKPNADSVVVPG